MAENRRRVEFSKSPSTLKTEQRKISLREYLNHEPTLVTPKTATDELSGDDSIQELSLSTPSIEWEHMVDQLNQDPRANSIADSSPGMAIMEEGEADVVGDKEVEVKAEGPSIEAAANAEAGDLVWDAQDPLFEFNDENSSVTQTPMAALTPVVMPAEEEMPDLKEVGSKEPSLRDSSESPAADAPKVTSIRGLVPDYSDIPLVGFSQLVLYQVMLWIHFEAQNMCEPPWHTELALIWQDEVV